MSIIVKNLTYIHSDKEVLFTNINLSVDKRQKVALVGNNGTGKSTILKILAGNLQPSSGEIISQSKPYYVPQHFGQYDDCTVGQTLGVDLKLNALYAILKGDIALENYSLLEEDWGIEEKVKKALSYWAIEHLDLSQKMGSLSGGEKTKVFLSGILIHSPDVILLDEPSNHLDSKSRILLIDFITESKSTILVVSHDRFLLNNLNITLEIYNNSIQVYGGNYSFYKVQKEKEIVALQSKLEEKAKNIKQIQIKSQGITEQRQKQEARGKSQSRKGGIPRIVAGNLESKAEQSSSKLKAVHSDRIELLSRDLQQIQQQIEDYKVLKLDFTSGKLHKGKLLIKGDEVNLSYGGEYLWSSPLSFQVYSGDRIQICGDNGVGKTSLIKIMMSHLVVTCGSVYTADMQCLYIDQEYLMIDNSLTVFEQVQSYNKRHLLEHELKMLLHYHQFPVDTWDNKCEVLSGGEKMKLLLCCLTVSDNIPDVLIFDEPTNNLDTQSVDILTKAIKAYRGTIIVISHDQHFIDEVAIDKKIFLD